MQGASLEATTLRWGTPIRSMQCQHDASAAHRTGLSRSYQPKHKNSQGMILRGFAKGGWKCPPKVAGTGRGDLMSSPELPFSRSVAEGFPFRGRGSGVGT